MTLHVPDPLRHFAVPLVALGLALPLASPAFAGEPEQIEVTSQAAMEEWQKDATRKLENALRRSPGRGSLVPNNGIVQIAFRMGENGRPDDLTVHSNSANLAAAHMARYAVRRLGDLSTVPVADGRRARFLANIIFAADRVEEEKLMIVLAESERARLAAGEARSAFIALGGQQPLSP